MVKRLNGNLLMLCFSFGVLIIAVTVYILHRIFGFLESYSLLMGVNNLSPSMNTLLYILLGITAALVFTGFALFRTNPNHRILPLIITLALTHGSMLIIASGDGLVEYHFSIFMVLALIAYYNSIAMLSISAGIFAPSLSWVFLFSCAVVRDTKLQILFAYDSRCVPFANLWSHAHLNST